MNLVRRNPWGELEEMTGPLNRFSTRPDTRRSKGEEMMPVSDWAVPVNDQRYRRGISHQDRSPRLKNETVRVTLDKGMFTLQDEQKEE